MGRLFYMRPLTRNGSKKEINLLRKFIFLLSLTFLGIMTSCNKQSNKIIDVQGHRGARGLLPENTLVGFEYAIDLGVTTLELDVGVTKDLHVVAYHDEYISESICTSTIDTLSLKNRLPYLLKELTLEQVKSFDCGTKNPDISRFPEPPRANVPGETIPTLDEVFQLATNKESLVRFNIEIKLDPTKNRTVPLEIFVQSVVDVIQKNNMTDRVVIQSFNWAVIERVKKLQPKITTAALLGTNSGLPTKDGHASPWTNGIHFNEV